MKFRQVNSRQSLVSDLFYDSSGRREEGVPGKSSSLVSSDYQCYRCLEVDCGRVAMAITCPGDGYPPGWLPGTTLHHSSIGNEFINVYQSECCSEIDCPLQSSVEKIQCEIHY